MRFLFAYLIAGFLIWPPVLKGQEGAISQDLYQKIQANPKASYHVGILLKDRVNVHSIYQSWKKLKPDLDKRNAFLIHKLKSKAAQSQAPLLKSLIENEATQSVRGYWLTNVIFCKILGQEALKLSFNEEIDQIFETGLIENDYEETDEPSFIIPGSRENGHAVIGATALWAMGYTGYGTKVLNIDSGIFPDHPSYKDRYWGHVRDKSQAWFDPGFRYSAPEFCNWHGSHTLGTILGLDSQTEDTIGVAFEAHWMGANATCPGRTTEDIIATFQWAMDPDGDSTTRSDVPDVINNSWTDATFANECQNNLYRDIFLALEANGIALVFSAGNTGPNASSIPPPKNINIDEVNTFTVGVINGNSSQLNLISFSSRGPSDCPGSGSLAIKPEVVAPGFQVRSAHIDGSYRSRSGTSMAAPHASGALLLLKQAFPALPGYELKRALYLTATDLGDPGEDNNYGRGLIAVDSAFAYLIQQGNTASQPNPELDVTIDSIGNVSELTCASSWQPMIYISNQGTLPITSMEVQYHLDGQTRTTNWVGNLVPGQQLPLRLAQFELEAGMHQFSLNLALPGNPLESRTLDNQQNLEFYSYIPGIPVVKNFPICKEADAAFFAHASGKGEVRWFSEENELIGSGERLWYGQVIDPEILSLAIFPTYQVGPSFPVPELEEFEADSSYFIQFDVERPFFLKGFDLLAAGSSQLAFKLKNRNNQLVYETREIVQKGSQFIPLNWQMEPGQDYILLVNSTIPLLRQSEGISYPIDGAGIMRFNASNGGRQAFNYFYNWQIEYELPCSRQSLPIRIVEGNMRSYFEVREKDDYFFASDSLEFLDQSGPAKSWFWDLGDGSQTNLRNPVHLYQDSGQFVVYLVSEGKDNCADAHRDTVNFAPRKPDQISPPLTGRWSIFPNPTHGTIFLKNPEFTQGSLEARLLSLLGKPLHDWKRLLLKDEHFQMDLSHQRPGIYLLEMKVGDAFFYKKILITRQ